VANISIRVEGLAELRKALARLGELDARNDLRDGLKKAADIVAQEAKSRVPKRSGRAAGAVRATAGGNRAYVVGGKKAVPYYGWLDFGGRTPRLGNPRSVGPWSGASGGPPKGRFIYPALDAKEREVVEAVGDSVQKAVRKAGF
jgi:HK97 gp10 family phage protein